MKLTSRDNKRWPAAGSAAGTPGRQSALAGFWRLVRSFDASYLYAMMGEATLALTFVLYVLLARVLGPERYGLFSAAAALAGILSVFIQFGLPVLLQRDVAENPAAGSRNVLVYLIIQTAHVIPTLLILALILPPLGFRGEGVTVCYLMILAEFGRGVKMLWRCAMKGRGWFRKESVSVALERFFVAAAAAVVLVWTKNLPATVATLAAARLIDNVGVGIYLSRKLRLGRALNRAAVAAVYRKVYPFALHGLLWILYYQVDVVMLNAMASQEQVGYYGAAYRLIEMLSALPRVVFYVGFTHFAKAKALNPADLPRVVYAETRILLMMVLPCLVVVGYAQPWVVRTLFGQAYAPSILLLAVLLPSLGVKLFSTLSEEYLLATDGEKKLPPMLLVVAASNIIANLFMIPRWGALGAALATVLSECLFCVMGMWFLARHRTGRAGARLTKLILPCALLCAAPSLVIFGFTVWVSLAVLTICAAAIVFFMRGMQRGFQGA